MNPLSNARTAHTSNQAKEAVRSSPSWKNPDIQTPHIATLKVNMPTSTPHTDPAPSPPAPTPGAKNAQSPNDSNSDRNPDEPDTVSASGSTTESPTLDATTVPSEASIPEELATNKRPKGKRFRPSQEKNAKCVSWPFSIYRYSPDSGVYVSANGLSKTPKGPGSHLTSIIKSCRKKNIRCAGRTVTDSNPADNTPQELEETAKAERAGGEGAEVEVVSTSIPI